MTTLREAAAQALEALEQSETFVPYEGFGMARREAERKHQAAITALRAALAEPALQTCNCRWDGEVQVQQCTLHEAHVDAIKEWAQRAKFAEKKLAALAEQRLTDMEQKMERSIESLKTALAEPEGGGNLPPPLQKDFDHGIGADRFKVVRGAFWWHVLIGDSPTEHGKFRSRAGAEKMAADLLREFRNGAFVQREAALAEPAQEPVAWSHNFIDNIITHRPADLERHPERWTALYPEPKPCPTCEALARTVMMDQTGYDTAPPQRMPLTEEEIDSIWDSEKAFADIYAITRAIERAHGIT